MSEDTVKAAYVDQLVSVNDLTIDPEVQRFTHNPRKVEHIVKNFNPNALDLITVSRRNAATMVIIDGWHRWEAVRRLTDSTGTLLCRVFDGLTKAEEAKMFLNLNPGNQPTALDRYRMRLVFGDPIIAAIDKAVHAYGWAVHPVPAVSHIQAVIALERIQKLALRNEATHDLLENTMLVITRTWGHEREASSAILLEGTAHFLAEYRAASRFDQDRLIEQAKGVQPFTLISDSQQMARMTRMRPSMAVADQLVKLYNSGLKVNGPKELSPWRRAR